jgi:polar amino acid transport system ATP-binding protein
LKLELSGVSKRYGSHQALADISLTLPHFHALAVIGPSGGGKTTLLRIIAGLELPDAGEVVTNGERLGGSEESLRAHRRSIGTVFQAFNLFPHLTALGNITLPLEKVHDQSPAEAREQALAILRRFQLVEHADKRPAQLSGGQQQRVAIARAIAIKPKFLLFDEPTSALDPEMTAEVLEIIDELRGEGRDLVLVTHHMGFASKVADQCIFVANGEIGEHGPAAELFGAPRSAELQSFLAKVLKY